MVREDVIQANILACQHDASGEILNISCNHPINLIELAKLMLKLTGKEELKIEYTDPRPGDITHSYGDVSKAKKMIKFEPKYNQEEGLRDYFIWYRKKYKIDLDVQ